MRRWVGFRISASKVLRDGFAWLRVHRKNGARFGVGLVCTVQGWRGAVGILGFWMGRARDVIETFQEVSTMNLQRVCACVRVCRPRKRWTLNILSPVNLERPSANCGFEGSRGYRAGQKEFQHSQKAEAVKASPDILSPRPC